MVLNCRETIIGGGLFVPRLGLLQKLKDGNAFEEIGVIVETIEERSQTNLLALNAAINRARRTGQGLCGCGR
jgi:hypothetical protein